MSKQIMLKIGTETTELDAAFEKAKQLKALLVEVKALTDSLGSLECNSFYGLDEQSLFCTATRLKEAHESICQQRPFSLTNSCGQCKYASIGKECECWRNVDKMLRKYTGVGCQFLQPTIKQMFDECIEKEHEAVRSALELIKNDAETYKEVLNKIQHERRQLMFDFEGRHLYGGYFEEMLELIEKEKSDLPLTNRP